MQFPKKKTFDMMLLSTKTNKNMEKRELIPLKFGPRLNYDGHSPANREWSEYNAVPRYALGFISDKYGKNHAWNTITGKWDLDKKGIQFTILCDQDKTRETYASYEDICKEFYWKSFKLSEDKSSVIADPLSFEEKEALFHPLIAKTKSRDKKLLKELEKSGEVQEDKTSEANAVESEPSFDIEDL